MKNQKTENYDFEMIISPEEFKRNKQRMIKKEEIEKNNQKIKTISEVCNWLVLFLVIILVTILLVKSSKEYNDIAHQCDSEKGRVCTYYEVRQHMLGK